MGAAIGGGVGSFIITEVLKFLKQETSSEYNSFLVYNLISKEVGFFL
jgi:hypothetical protein